jgi:cytochrome c-type biogenesis protein CcmH
MLLFWSLAILLLAATLAFLLPPLVRGRRGTSAPDADAAAIAVYRDQKRALDDDFANGALSDAERDAAILELSRRLGEEVGAPKQASHLPRRRAWLVAIALLIVIPLAAVALYARLGSPDATATAVADGTPAPHEMSDPQIIAMVDKLAQRMKSRPDDGEGWALLARSYAALGRFPEAADAYARADALMPDNPALLADYADALGMSQGKQLAGKPAELIRRALALDPQQRKALALAATAAMDAHDLDGALGYWRRLGAEFPPDSEEARRVNAIIAEIESDKNEGKAGAGANAKAAPRAPGVAAPAAGQAQVARSVGGTIAGRVDIAPALAPKVALTDTVFIFARAVDGPRVPLAVLRLAARELPRDFTLDDSMGMAPGVKLSAASAVVVEARVSKSGNALPQPGDLTGRSAAVKPGTAGVKITIDQVVP